MVSIVAKAPHSTVTPLRAAGLALGGLDLALALAVEAEAEAEPGRTPSRVVPAWVRWLLCQCGGHGGDYLTVTVAA